MGTLMALTFENTTPRADEKRTIYVDEIRPNFGTVDIKIVHVAGIAVSTAFATSWPF